MSSHQNMEMVVTSTPTRVFGECYDSYMSYDLSTASCQGNFTSEHWEQIYMYGEHTTSDGLFKQDRVNPNEEGKAYIRSILTKATSLDTDQ